MAKMGGPDGIRKNEFSSETFKYLDVWWRNQGVLVKRPKNQNAIRRGTFQNPKNKIFCVAV